MNDWFLDFPLVKRKASAREKFSSRRTGIARVGQNPAVNGFKCTHCRGFICTERVLSSVNNRNHCPYCLWSRHLDHLKPGDRLSACKAPMQPLGLTLKKNYKKYGPARSGEMMLIHVCQDCGKVSLNRIAADDDVEKVFEVYTQSFEQDLSANLRAGENTSPACSGGVDIHILQAEDMGLVQTRLFGSEMSRAGFLAVEEPGVVFAGKG